jgi:hypothetical protein
MGCPRASTTLGTAMNTVRPFNVDFEVDLGKHRIVQHRRKSGLVDCAHVNADLPWPKSAAAGRRRGTRSNLSDSHTHFERLRMN